MTTLTSVAQTTRRVIIFLLFIIVVMGFLFIIYSSIKNTILTLKPAPKPVISTTFGKIPKVIFPQQFFPSDIKFNVETISGGIPEASPTAKIYFLPKKQQSLLSNIRINQDVKKIGFTVSPQTVEKRLLFKESGKELLIDPITRNFTYSYDFTADGSVFQGDNKLTAGSVQSGALNFLNSLSATPQDYDSSNPKITFLTFSGKEFVPTIDEKDNINATSARVDLFRKNIDGLPIVTPKYKEGNIFVIVSKSSDKSKQIIKAQRVYQEISYENIGVYPIKKSQLAWEKFISGDGYIANFGNSPTTKKVVIRDAFLAYYDNPDYQTYLMPIFVFIGDNGFVGYVNAISEEWLIESDEGQPSEN